MDGANVNGGNAEAPREDSNLENSDATVLTVETRDSLSGKTQSTTDGNAELQEVNGDVKNSSRKPGAVSLRRKMRKSKANSTSTVESDGAETLGVGSRKRKHSEFDDASSEDSEFNGFDSQVLELQPGSLVLKKLIAEAEIAEAQCEKRIRYSNRSFDGREKKEDNQDIEDMRAYIFETDSLEDVAKVKKESDKSETDSMDITNSIDSEIEPNKIEDISIKSANSSSAASSPSAASPRSKGSRFSRGLSPGGKHRSPIDMANPIYKEPFKYGWRRELVFRATNDSAFKRMADIYYYTPKGKKVRSFREVAESLNSKELTIDNFTFFKEPIGLDDPEKEIIRDAKRIRGSGGFAGRKSFGRKSLAAKKPVPEPIVKKPVQEPVTRRSVQESRKIIPESPASVSTSTPAPAPTPAPTPAAEASKLTPPISVPTRAATKAKASTSPADKTKTSAKKTPQITEMKSAAEEPEMLPPQRNTPNTRRNQQPVEKVTSVKTKRLLTSRTVQHKMFDKYGINTKFTMSSLSLFISS